MPGCLQAPSQAMSGVATGPRSFWTKSPAGRRRGNEEGLAQEPRAAGSTAGGRGHSPRWQLIPITAAGWALPPRKEQTAHSWEWSPRPGPPAHQLCPDPLTPRPRTVWFWASSLSLWSSGFCLTL